MDGHKYRVTGLYRTNGVSYGNSTMLFPLPALQGRHQAAGQVTLGFVKLAPGANSAQIVSLVIGESLVVSLAGAAVGVFLGGWRSTCFSTYPSWMAVQRGSRS